VEIVQVAETMSFTHLRDTGAERYGQTAAAEGVRISAADLRVS
jgi:hypothetical protein